MERTLASFLPALAVISVEGPTGGIVSSLACHTDQVGAGSVFFCLRGSRRDGHEYIKAAVAAGAGAVVLEENRPVSGAAKILVPDVRLALAVMSRLFYGHPSAGMRLIGVTGTNGKTTVTHLVRQILEAHGERTGLLGTISCHAAARELPVLATTPEAPDLQASFKVMQEEKVTSVVMEVSSHALELQRVSGCAFSTAVLTNVTGDHLDFHGDFARYLAAKGKLFAQLGSVMDSSGLPRFAVINADDPHAAFFKRQSAAQWVTYGLGEEAMVRASALALGRRGASFQFHSPWGELPFSLQLAGRFNVYNALAAATVALLEGVPLELVHRVLEAVPGIPGRFEKIEQGQDYTVIVDYAHTADSLDNVLQAASELAGTRIITVFGCGGDRDRTKRPLMGRIAAQYSDICVITSDNPRSEDPMAIIGEIVAGMEEKPSHSERRFVEVDRRAAINLAVRLANAGDIVLIAGKGHETDQVFDGYSERFSDREVAAAAIEERLGRS